MASQSQRNCQTTTEPGHFALLRALPASLSHPKSVCAFALALRTASAAQLFKQRFYCD